MTAHPADIAPRPGTGRLSGNGFALLSTVIWSAGFPAAELLLARWDPVALVPARMAMALLLLVPLLLLLEGRPRGLPWERALWIGGLGLGGGAMLLILAQAVTDPVTVAVVACASPLMATLVEWAVERRRLSRWFVLGLLASILGGVVATSAGEAGGGHLLLGALLAVGSCLIYSWATNESVRSLPGRTALARTTATVSGAFLGSLGIALAWGLWAGAGLPMDGIGARDLGLLAIYGIGGMALSQMLFVLAVERIGVALSSFHLNVAPFYVMLILVALGGDWSWTQALGAAIVLLGVLLAQR